MDLLTPTYAATTAVVADLDPDGFARPTRAAAWSVRELLLHQLLDAQRALVALATPTTQPVDVDATTYWHAWHPAQGDGGAAHAAYVQRAAAAYDGTAGLVGQWRSTSAATARACAARDPGERVETQGHVITAGDLASTLVVEATVHLLDLTLHLPGEPPAEALAHTHGVLESLYGGPLPDAWSDTEAVLRGTGRVPSDDRRLPLLG
jgi:hypothetical protein